MSIDREQISSRFSGDVEGEQRYCKRGHQETSANDEYAHYLDCGDVSRVCVYVCFLSVYLLYANYTSIKFLQKKGRKKVILGIYPFVTRM